MSEQIFTVNTIRLCLDRADDELQGTLCGVCMKEAVSFSNTSQLVQAVDAIYDEIGRPQPSEIYRSFAGDSPAYLSYVGSPKKYHSDADIESRRGKAHTLDLVVQTRKHAEWQGVVLNEERKPLGEFKTMLQCIEILEHLEA